MSKAAPEVLQELPGGITFRARVRCPGCGLDAWIDSDQFAGRVSIDCPECDYHETHDLRGAGS